MALNHEQFARAIDEIKDRKTFDPMDETKFEVVVTQVECTIPETFYLAKVAALKKLMRETTVNKMVSALAQDFELLAFLMLSPAHLKKLEHELREAVSPRAATLITTEKEIETLAVIRQGLQGFKFHFGTTKLEKGWNSMMNALDVVLDESTTEAAALLKSKVHWVGSLLISGKNRIVNCERSLITQPSHLFLPSYGLNCSYFRKYLSIFITYSYVMSEQNVADFGWTSGDSTFENKQKHQAQLIFQDFVYLLFRVLSSIQTPAVNGLKCAVALWSFLSFSNLMCYMLKIALRHHMGVHWTKYLLSVFIAIIGLCIYRLGVTRQFKLQAQTVGSEKKFLGVLSFCVMVIYMFDTDLADAMSNGLHKISRLVGMFVENYRGFGSSIATYELQHGTTEEQLSIVNNVISVALNIVDQETDAEIIDQDEEETFGAWCAMNISAGINLSRPLQFECKRTFALNSMNVDDVSLEMVESKNAWSMVVGLTGSGKSTRLPVAYYNLISRMPSRRQKILVCEPTQASTVSVVAGISQNLQHLVYGQHEGWRNQGDRSISVMTYGSAFQSQVNDSNFIKGFDAVFLDEAHLISEHSLAFESQCDVERTVRKFYMSATPRDGSKCPEAVRKFPLTVHNSECHQACQITRAYGSGDALDISRHNAVLVFLSGRKECEKAAIEWNKSITSSGAHQAYFLTKSNFATDYNKYVTMLQDETHKCIIFVTNILETGVTMNVDCVIDMGNTMRPELDLVSKTLRLKRFRVTENERQQRIGRAGRLKPGFAIACGKTERRSTIVPPDTMYGAALLSFIHGLTFYMDEHFESSWLGDVTKKQAAVMAQFRLSPFLLRDLIQKDGAICETIFPYLKPYLFKVCDFQLTKAPVTPFVYSTWPRYHNLVSELMRGEGEVPSDLKLAKVPFIIAHTDRFEWEAFARAAMSFAPRVTTIFKGISDNTRVITLQTSKHNIEQSIAFMKTLKNTFIQAIHNRCNAISNIKNNTFMSRMALGNQTKAMEKSKAQLQANLEVVIKNLSVLEMMTNDGEVTVDEDSHQKVLKIIELQARECLNEEEASRALGIMFPRMNITSLLLEKGPALILSLLFMLATSLLYLIFYIKKDTKKEEQLLSDMLNVTKSKTELTWPVLNGDEANHDVLHYELEAAGRKYNRDKRADVPKDENQQYNDFHAKVVTSRNKFVSTKPETSVIRYVKPNFFNFYDITSDEQVVQAIFKTTDGEVFHKTANPHKDIRKLQKLLDDFQSDIPSTSTSWADIADDHSNIICEITTKDGAVLEVNMNKHNSEQRGKATLNPVGYAERNGEFRQVGGTRVLKAAEYLKLDLEAKTVKPLGKCRTDIANNVGAMQVGDYVVNCVLYGDWVIAPAHIQERSGKATIAFAHSQCVMTTEDLNAYGVVRFKDADLIAIRRPAKLKPTKKMAQAAVIRPGTEVQMFYVGSAGNHFVSASDTIQKEFHARWSHTITTEVGMCGCMVVDTATHAFVGIHIAADTIHRRNVFQSFTHEMIKVFDGAAGMLTAGIWRFIKEEHGYEGCELTRQAAVDFSVVNEAIAGFGFGLTGKTVSEANGSVKAAFLDKFGDGSFKLFGKMQSGLIDKHIFVGENKFFFDFLEQCPKFQWLLEHTDEYAPSVLSFDAYFKDVSKFNRHLHHVSPDAKCLEAAKKKLISMLEDAGMTPTIKRTSDEVMRDLQWNTSCGAPYQGKKLDVLEHLTDDQLIIFGDVCDTKFQQGLAPGIWNGSLKAELRTMEKVREFKTRVFTAAPITSLIAMKFYVDDFNKQFYKTHLRAPHTVGINKFERGWEMLYKKLNRPGWKHGSGDGSRFDSSIDPFLFEIVKDVRKHFFQGNCNKQIDNIYEEIVNTKISLANGMVIQKCLGNNSGQPSTVVDNTLVLITSFLYAYARKTGDHDFVDLEENFQFVCNGDDNKFSISPQFLARFGADFSPQMRELGLTYVFDEITDDIYENPYMSLTMVPTIFGVGFTLAIERIVAILQWTKKDGLLHAYLSGIAALVESFNTPRLFVAIYTYLLWLVDTHQDELMTLMDLKGVFMVIPTIAEISHLHYAERPCYELQSGKAQDPTLTEPPPEQNTGDLAVVEPKHVWAMPQIKPTKSAFGTRLSIDKLRNVPAQALEHNVTVALESQLARWVDGVRSDLGITTDAHWEDLLISWIGWCIHNGTSDKIDETAKFELKGDMQAVQEIPVLPFVRHGKLNGGLRRIMRCYSDDAVAIIQTHPTKTRWGMRHGMTGAGHYSFDFFVQRDYMSSQAVDQVKQARLAALGVGSSNTMITSDKTNLLKTKNRRVTDYTGREAEDLE